MYNDEHSYDEFDINNKEVLRDLAKEASKKLSIQKEEVESSREESFNGINLNEAHYNYNEDVTDLYREEDFEDDYELGNVNEIFPGGPTEAMLELWKRTYPECIVFAVTVSSQIFIARSITRLEYKKLIGLPIDQLQREEVICSTCVLYPFNITWEDVNMLRGGIPSTLASVIMENSGFTTDYEIEVL